MKKYLRKVKNRPVLKTGFYANTYIKEILLNGQEIEYFPKNKRLSESVIDRKFVLKRGKKNFWDFYVYEGHKLDDYDYISIKDESGKEVKETRCYHKEANVILDEIKVWKFIDVFTVNFKKKLFFYKNHIYKLHDLVELTTEIESFENIDREKKNRWTNDKVAAWYDLISITGRVDETNDLFFKVNDVEVIGDQDFIEDIKEDLSAKLLCDVANSGEVMLYLKGGSVVRSLDEFIRYMKEVNELKNPSTFVKYEAPIIKGEDNYSHAIAIVKKGVISVFALGGNFGGNKIERYRFIVKEHEIKAYEVYGKLFYPIEDFRDFLREVRKPYICDETLELIKAHSVKDPDLYYESGSKDELEHSVFLFLITRSNPLLRGLHQAGLRKLSYVMASSMIANGSSLARVSLVHLDVINHKETKIRRILKLNNYQIQKLKEFMEEYNNYEAIKHFKVILSLTDFRDGGRVRIDDIKFLDNNTTDEVIEFLKMPYEESTKLKSLFAETLVGLLKRNLGETT